MERDRVLKVDRDFEHTGRLKRMLPPTNKLLPSYWYHWGISQISCAQFGERTLVWPEEARRDAIRDGPGYVVGVTQGESL